MPRFYFDVVSGGSIVSDEEGAELPSLEYARLEAISDARYLMSQAVLQGYDVSHKVMRIRNEQGDVAISVLFADTISRPL
ncbi:DUF6894 family protein [Neorhizobium sp. DAR64860/K0K1]|uniref:DUF6894 family protein n=1 Tax=Neorhizobium sp. DAR64860/K0K1 TaxID=3421955 RepID=UPI003D267D4A